MDERLTARRGLSLVELLIALALGSLLVAGLLLLFRVHSGLAQRESLTADLQQALRIARHEVSRVCRMAGRGGLPRAIAIEIRNNVGPGERIGGPGTSAVVPGTDVLIVRGVFEGPILAVAWAEEREAGRGALALHQGDGAGGVQELEPILELALSFPGEALLLSDGAGTGRCSLVELAGGTGSRRNPAGQLEELILDYRSGGSEAAEGYRELAAACKPLLPEWISRVGILVEYRFYVRRDQSQLMRARFRPGSDRTHAASTPTGEIVVDYALDLQAALGIDLDGDGFILEGEGAHMATDEWRYNDPADRTTAWSTGHLGLVRLTLLMRAARARRGYLSPPLKRIEDRLYEESELPAWRQEHRRFLRARSTAWIGLRSG